MEKLKLCTNGDCKNKYVCKRYCSSTPKTTENSSDLKEKCNADNEYVLYKHWNITKKRNND